MRVKQGTQLQGLDETADRGGSIDADSFARTGFAGPVRLMGAEQCRALARYLNGTRRVSPPVWIKGRGASDGILARIASHPALVSLLTPLLGEDIVLWGASTVRRSAGSSHPWHSDIESSRPEGGFVSAWIGLQNVSEDSSLRFVAGSHLCPKPLQQIQAEHGDARGTPSSETVLSWARRDNPAARLVEVPASNGDAILFDGRIWHGSENRLEGGERLALLLQFAAADVAVRIPNLGNLKWPFTFLDQPRPPVIAVHGSARADVNKVVDMPSGGPPKPLPQLQSTVRALDSEPDESKNWQPFPLFRGRTAALDLQSCHAAMLRPGFSPHPPHAHQDEELLIVLDGEADLLVSDRPAFEGAQAITVKAGDFAYYPAFQHHTIRNSADRPVHYLMFRWNRAEAEAPSGRLKAVVVRDPPPAEPKEGRGFSVRTVFEGRTQWLRKLHCHASRLEPGAGYAPHADAYDVAILVQSGRVRTLGREAGPGELIYYPAGELHGMRNAGDEPAHYLVFEFHGAPVTVAQAALAPTAAVPALA